MKIRDYLGQSTEHHHKFCILQNATHIRLQFKNLVKYFDHYFLLLLKITIKKIWKITFIKTSGLIIIYTHQYTSNIFS